MIEDIEIPKDKLTKLEITLKQVGHAYRARHNAIRRLGLYICSRCDNAATKNVIRKEDGCQIIERFCDICLGKVNK